MIKTFNGWAALKPGDKLIPHQYDVGDLGADQVQLRVESCGICHSDLSMIDNDWGNAQFPLVAGHEAIGIIEAIGERVRGGLQVGQRVGVGWFAGACLSCQPCQSGRQQLCSQAEQTIVNRHGGFADRLRCDWTWAIPLPDQLNATSAGPLFCGGITVFAPIFDSGIKATARVGVIGIGGLGHLALQFLNKWGCHVTAFTSNPDKAAEAIGFGAHSVLDSRDPAAMSTAQGSFDFILSTVNVPMDWSSYLSLLAPDGLLHVVGAVLQPLEIPAFALISGRKRVAGSPLGSPATVKMMLDFCARHGIAPQIERFAMEDINEALAHLRAGKARYRLVLEH